MGILGSKAAPVETPSKKAVTRLYVVRVQPINGDAATHLVDASTPAQAIRHVMKGMVSAEVADSKTVAAIVGAGVKVELVDRE